MDFRKHGPDHVDSGVRLEIYSGWRRNTRCVVLPGTGGNMPSGFDGRRAFHSNVGYRFDRFNSRIALSRMEIRLGGYYG